MLPFSSSATYSSIFPMMNLCQHQTVPVCRSRHASTNSRAPHLPLPDVSGSSCYPRVLLLRIASVSRSPPSIFQLSHFFFFRVHSVGFSPPHQIFIEGETAQAGWARALSSPPSLLIRLPTHPALNLADSLALCSLPQEGSISGLDTSKILVVIQTVESINNDFWYFRQQKKM